ncbi:MAG: zinc ribbon domain-containing protein [Aeriscardovia sp.]|nr:zinc ribbon domain-containing protein [Aeriscardovia sp.]
MKPAGGKGEKTTCPNCHSQLEEGSNFCPYCGYPIRMAEDNMQSHAVQGPSANPEESPSSSPAFPQLSQMTTLHPSFPARREK